MYKKVNRLIRFTPVNRRECISGSRRNSGVNRICLKVKDSKLQAQTFVEYTLLFGVIVAIFIALTPLIRRSSQAMIKLVADQVSLQENAEQMGGDTGKLVNSEILTSQRREKNTRQFAGIMNYTFVQDDLEVHSDSVSNLGFTQKRP